MSRNYEEELKLIVAEKNKVKAASSATVNSRSNWQPIATEWFEKWKLYVDFSDTFDQSHRTPELIKSLYPGEIDNSSLKGAFGDELKRGLVDTQDYVLLPSDVVAPLVNHYKGGPQFPRTVQNLGTVLRPLYQVVLYPVRFDIFYCDDKTPEPKDKPDQIRYYAANPSFKSAVDSFKSLFFVTGFPIRVWLKDNCIDASSVESLSVNGDYKRARTSGLHRRILSEDVERHNNWKLFRAYSDFEGSVRDILGDGESIQIIIESVKKYSPLEVDWPRNKFLQDWKKSLQSGDLIDAFDKSRKWNIGKVKTVDQEGNVSVHFIGFNESCDIVINAQDHISRILCLHVRTVDRLAAWQEGTSIDICVTEPDQETVWVGAKVMELDLANEKLKASFSKNFRDSQLKLLSSASPIASTEAMDVEPNENDDAIKKRATSVLGETTVEETKILSTTVDSVMETDDQIEKWFDIYGEYVCPIYTHTTKPATHVTTVSTIPKTTSYGGYSSYYDNVKGSPIAKGIVGLQNLGNTCFMNSILQCLSSTYSLTQVFLSDSHLKQINYDNPLGHRGKVALAYAKLMKDIWSNEFVKIAPRDFKLTIGEFQPQFAGYYQQDSQEFMNFLFDGLHEDMNRIHKKPFVQKIESKGRPDDLIASESWRRFLLRNDSELVDRCYGQLKSHVTCANCRNESVTFEAYSSISLPIPIKNTKPIDIIVQLLPLGSTPLKVSVNVEVGEPMSNLRKILIDHLLALKVKLISSSDISISKRKYTEDGFELVESKEEFQFVSKEGQEIPDLDTSVQFQTSIYDNIHFHFSGTYMSRPYNICKNYNASSSSRTAVSSFIARNETLLAFQLEENAPELKSSLYGVEEFQTSDSHFYAVDICFDRKKEAGPSKSDSIIFKTYPSRIILHKGMSNHHVYLKVRQVLNRFLHCDRAQDGNVSLPFELLVTNSFGRVIKPTLEDSDSVAFSIATDGTEVLAAILIEEGSDWNFSRFGDLDEPKCGADNSDVQDNAKSGVDLFDCFDKFVEKEQLGDADTVYCSNCKQHTPPTKKMDVWSAPDVLILHLKRFQIVPGESGFHRREKINDFISFPIDGLDLTKYVKGPQDLENSPPIYDLYAVSHHMGGLGGGHYVATCKHPMNGKWYNCNDSSVMETESGSAVSASAYVLFYKRRRGSSKWGGVVPLAQGLADED